MFTNFSETKFSKLWKIESECVKDDYHALENLISEDEAKRRTGFMAFSASGPPININLSSTVKIDLKAIRIHSVLGSLKSTKFQIFFECPDSQNRKVLRKIANIHLNEDEKGFLLKTSDFRSNESEDSLKIIIIPPTIQRQLNSVDVIRIMIQDTKFRRSPVIKKLEVFGSLSSKNTEEEIKFFNSLNEIPKIEEKKTASIAPEQTSSEKLNFTIPEEFLDSITQEILDIPYILPSGAVVDLSTLEKHKNAEACNLRLPYDPFTGVLFTADHQPRFDASLKMRLDKFKLLHSNEIEVINSGRSVGRKEVLCEPSTSTANNHVAKKIKLSNPGSSLDELIQSIYSSNQISTFLKPKAKEKDAIECSKCKSNEIINLYKITLCQHIFCKSCMLQLHSKCSCCTRSFETKDVIKIH